MKNSLNIVPVLILMLALSFSSCVQEDSPDSGDQNITMSFNITMFEADVAMNILVGDEITLENIISIPFESTRSKELSKNVQGISPYLAVSRTIAHKYFDLSVKLQNKSLYNNGGFGSTFNMFLDAKGNDKLLREFKDIIEPYLKENFSEFSPGNFLTISIWVIDKDKITLLQNIKLK